MTGKISAETSGTFNLLASNGVSKTEKALREHNVGPQKVMGHRRAITTLDKSPFCGEDLRFNPSQRVLYSSRRPRASVRQPPARRKP